MYMPSKESHHVSSVQSGLISEPAWLEMEAQVYEAIRVCSPVLPKRRSCEFLTRYYVDSIFDRILKIRSPTRLAHMSFSREYFTRRTIGTLFVGCMHVVFAAFDNGAA
jgi:hypothetical protein